MPDVGTKFIPWHMDALVYTVLCVRKFIFSILYCTQSHLLLTREAHCREQGRQSHHGGRASARSSALSSCRQFGPCTVAFDHRRRQSSAECRERRRTSQPLVIRRSSTETERLFLHAVFA